MTEFSDADIDKLSNEINKKRKADRWWADPVKAKKYGPIVETLCWSLFLISLISIIGLGLVSSGPFTYNMADEHEFAIDALEKLDCVSLKEISLSLIHKDQQGSSIYSEIRSNLNSEILARC